MIIQAKAKSRKGIEGDWPPPSGYFLITWDYPIQHQSRLSACRSRSGANSIVLLSHCHLPYRTGSVFWALPESTARAHPILTLTGLGKNVILFSNIFWQICRACRFCGTNVEFKYRSIFQVGQVFGLPKRNWPVGQNPMQLHDKTQS
jgi:hypothetical protein